MKVGPIRIEVRVESREQDGAMLWSGTAELIEPGRRPFEVIDSASCRDLASPQECAGLAVLALQDRISHIYGVGNHHEVLFRAKLREIENEAKSKWRCIKLPQGLG